MVGLTKVVALEAAEHGVTCNAVCPGYVWTPLVEKQIDEQAAAHEHSARAGGPRRAPGRAADASASRRSRRSAATVAFLCGPARGLDHRRGAAGRWRLDRALSMTGREEPCAMDGSATAARAGGRLRAGAGRRGAVNLALQGGGAHGAFTWGVLDRLLEERAPGDRGHQRHLGRRDERGRAGLRHGDGRAGRGARGARPVLAAGQPRRRRFSPLQPSLVRPACAATGRCDNSPAFLGFDLVTRLLRPTSSIR